jgi:Domain of unknown function (DUF4832)/Domain of unknown function (DUF4874)
MNTIGKILFHLALGISLFGCKKNTVPVGPVEPEGVTYEVSANIFPNPERGFMRTMQVYSEGTPLSLAQLQTFRSQNISLLLRVFYLEAFKNSALSAAQLNLIQTDLDKVRQAGLKAILRFGYTDNISGTDAPFTIISQHIDQLRPIFQNNQDIISFVQAGFIGAWGEWHSSSNGLSTTENRRLVLNKLLEALPQGIMVQVRTPGYKQDLFNTALPVTSDIAWSADNRARVGHHNDCFLTGGSDYGTYNNIVAEKQYISNEAMFVPTGGETCPPTAGFDPSCSAGRNEMKLLKWTYLNLDYYPATINGWKNSGCFDEFQTYLGYRLALVSALFPSTAMAGSNLAVKMDLTNRGYAPMYNKKITWLVLKNQATGTYYEKQLAIDLRECKPSATLSVDESVSLSGIPAGTYSLYLRVADQAPSLKPRIEYSVRLANTDGWVEDNGGMNNFKQQITIN